MVLQNWRLTKLPERRRRRQRVLTQTFWLFVIFTLCIETQRTHHLQSTLANRSHKAELDTPCCAFVINQQPFDLQQGTWYVLLWWKNAHHHKLANSGQAGSDARTLELNSCLLWRHSPWNLMSYSVRKVWARNATRRGTKCGAKHEVRAVNTNSNILQASKPPADTDVCPETVSHQNLKNQKL